MKLKILVIAAAILLWAPPVQANVNDFIVTDFNGKYVLGNDVNGGRMRVTESIDLLYSDYNHGILRALPKTYKDNPLKLNIISVKRDGKSEPYTTYEESGNEVIKIGSKNRTITGFHSYEIIYELSNILSFYDDYDEWYWDINGDQWQQPFDSVRGEVIFPSGWSREGMPEARCFTGKYRVDSGDCILTPTDTGYKFLTTRSLNPNETLTIAAAIPKGIFSPRSLADKIVDNLSNILGISAGIAGAAVIAGLWWRHGKDYKGRGVIIPEYEPPENLTPAEVGLLADYNVDGRDLSSTIIDLAIRKYIRIHDEEYKVLGLFKRHRFSLELLNTDLKPLKFHENVLITDLFNNLKAGEKIAMEDIDKTKMQKTVKTIKEKLNSNLTKKYGLIEEKSEKYRAILILLPFMVLPLLIIFNLDWGWFVGFAIIGLSSYIFGYLMKRRSHAGVKTYEKIQGLKLYMDTVEKRRLKMLQSVDRPYAEPSKTPELFEKLLPFAVALGLEKSWAKQFEGIYKQPDWYTGNYHSFNMGYFAGNLSNATRAMNSSFAPPSNSGGSGVGGGGFSGGGGGGGGGGGW